MKRWLPVAALILCASLGGQRTSAQRGRAGTLPPTVNGFFGLSLGPSTLRDARTVLGSARIRHLGDAGDARHEVCYTFNAASPPTVMRIAANEEMAGPARDQITHISLQLLTANNHSAGCLRVFQADVKTPGGLALGDSEPAVQALLGQPTRDSAGTAVYEYASQSPMSPGSRSYAFWNARRSTCFEGKTPYFDISSAVQVTYRGGRVVALALSRIESAC
jgi:hypothetical protein